MSFDDFLERLAKVEEQIARQEPVSAVYDTVKEQNREQKVDRNFWFSSPYNYQYKTKQVLSFMGILILIFNFSSLKRTDRTEKSLYVQPVKTECSNISYLSCLACLRLI